MEVQQIRIQQQLLDMDFPQQANTMFKKEDLNHLEQ